MSDLPWPRPMFFDNPSDALEGEEEIGFQLLLFRELTEQEVVMLNQTFSKRDIYIEQQYHEGAWDSSWIDGSLAVKDAVKKLLIGFGFTEQK